MGVFKVFGQFILALYSMFLFWVMLVNLLSFSGVDVFSSGFYIYDDNINVNDFTNSYFGFSSIINAFADFPSSLFNQWIPHALNNLIEGLSGGVYRISAVINNSYEGIEIVRNLIIGVIECLIAPLWILVSIVEVLLGFFEFLFNILRWVALVFGGYYNTPLQA